MVDRIALAVLCIGIGGVVVGVYGALVEGCPDSCTTIKIYVTAIGLAGCPWLILTALSWLDLADRQD
jgi:hypothetical protein